MANDPIHQTPAQKAFWAVPEPINIPDDCKWCSAKHKGSLIFENANLCSECNDKALAALSEPQQLCHKCSLLTSDRHSLDQLRSENGFQHWSMANLYLSFEKGCPLCRILLVRDIAWEVKEHPTDCLRLLAKTEKRGLDKVEELTTLQCYLWASRMGSLSVSASPEDPAAQDITQLPPIHDPGSRETMKQLRGWLSDCIDNHHDSPIPKVEKPVLPTRVIDVCHKNGLGARLYVTDPNSKANYIALSYCWGSKGIVKTTMESFAAYKEEIDVSQLPQTFQDAIATTRGLGFRYLWIDALCIIQDSFEDKMKELGAMTSIYSLATLTIAVASANSVQEGFLRFTNPQTSVQIPYLCKDLSMGTINLTPPVSRNMWKEPLYSRAWCLQESLLSPRMLIYTGTEVVWQCTTNPFRRNDNNSISYDDEHSNFLRSDPFRRLPGAMYAYQPNLNANDGLDQAGRYSLWTSIVEDYTRRRMTVAEDKLPALSGIAQRFEYFWKDKYCAGLWASHFINMLSWHRQKHNRRVPRQKYELQRYRAPSWSWASIDGPIEFDEYFDSPDVSNISNLKPDLISCTVQPVSQHAPLAEVSSGEAVISASLIRATDSPYNPQARWAQFLPTSQTIQDYLPDGIGVSVTDVLSDEIWRETWFMLLQEGPKGGPSAVEEGGRRTTALILLPIQLDKNTFRRIGVYYTEIEGALKFWSKPEDRRTLTLI